MSLKLHNLTAPWRAEDTFCNLLKVFPAAILLGAFLLATTGKSFGQANNEYRSFQSGLWDDRSTWERYDGTTMTWQTPTAIQGSPNSSKNIITVRSPHIVTIDVSVSADQFTIEVGGQVTVNSGTNFTIANGASDMTVNGILDFSGNVTKTVGAIIFINGEVINRSGNLVIMGSGLLIFNANSIYRHLRNAGLIPNANWHSTSTCEVSGVLAGGITGLAQNFGNLTWNRVGQINNQNLPESGTMSIIGNLTIHSTGTGRLNLNQVFLNVGGNFIQSGGKFRLANADNDRTLTVNGNANITNDSLIMAAGGAGSMGVGTLEVRGNFSATGGTITETSLGTGHGNVLLNGSATQGITATGTISQSINFTVDNPNGVLLATDLTIPGDLTLTSGLFSLGAFDLQVKGAVSGGSSTVYVRTNGVGSLRQTVPVGSVFFPVGNGSYNPATLANTGTPDTLSVRVTDQVLLDGDSGAPVLEKVVNRTWFIEEDVAGGSILDITLQWDVTDEFMDFTANDCYVAHYTGSGWEASSAADASMTRSLNFSNITSLSPFSIASQGALPIELISFNAKPNGKAVQLDWRTASELNNAFFHIERSENSRDFVEIGKIQGAGTSHTSLEYRFTDAFPMTGWNYYRLRQEDFDGQFSFSPVKAVLMGKDGDPSRLQLFPNPVSNELQLKTADLIQPGDRLEIYDFTGQMVQRFSASDALNTPVDVSQLPAGSYTVRLHTAAGMRNASFMKQ